MDLFVLQVSLQINAVLFGCIELPDGMGERCFDRVTAVGNYSVAVETVHGK